jgi:hypothetical protein
LARASSKLNTGGVGPTLRNFGVTDAVADCTIDVYRDSYRMTGNDGWDANLNAPQLSFLFSQVGVFGLDEGSKDAVLLLTSVYPGTYTVVLSAKGGATGRGLIELYELP